MLVLAAACTESTPIDPGATVTGANGSAVPSPPVLQPDDLVDLTVYLRSGSGTTARLVPVVREVPVTDDLPRRALELLLAGPTAEEPELSAPLPLSASILGLTVEGGVATADFSDELIGDSSSVGASAENEVLALAALVDTLTEFTSIEQVQVTINGQRDDAERAFWGYWGLPDVLVRDESLFASAQGEGDGVVDLDRFTGEPQEVGGSGDDAARLTSVRVRERVTHTRIVIELADPQDAAMPASTVPVTRVRRANDTIVLLVSGISAVEAGALDGLQPTQGISAISAIRSEVDEGKATVRLVLNPVEVSDSFWLHTLTNPTRVILDVRR